MMPLKVTFAAPEVPACHRPAAIVAAVCSSIRERESGEVLGGVAPPPSSAATLHAGVRHWNRQLEQRLGWTRGRGGGGGRSGGGLRVRVGGDAGEDQKGAGRRGSRHAAAEEGRRGHDDDGTAESVQHDVREWRRLLQNLAKRRNGSEPKGVNRTAFGSASRAFPLETEWSCKESEEDGLTWNDAAL